MFDHNVSLRFGSEAGLMFDLFLVGSCPKDRCPRLMEYYEMVKDRPSIKASWPPHWLDNLEGPDLLKNL